MEDDDLIFRQNESRLDDLLNKMNENTSNKESRRASEKSSHHGKSKDEEDMVHNTFGSLLEQHVGSLDLKKEMEKLKKLEEE